MQGSIVSNGVTYAMQDEINIIQMRYILVLLTFLCWGVTTYAQSDRLFRFYADQSPTELMDSSYSSPPSLYHRKIKKKLSRVARPEEWEEWNIPIVFHILKEKGSPMVTQRQVREQIDALNRDFGGQTPLTKNDDRLSNGAYTVEQVDTRIRFCFPPHGSSIAARKTLVKAKHFKGKKKKDVLAPFTGTMIDPDRFLNVWVVTLPGDTAGYASPPQSGELIDGIIIDPRFFGSSGTAEVPFNQGKTLTHLVGRYLGLDPLWGENSCADDGIADTPVHNAPNYGKPGRGHVSTCDGNPLEMTMNFMDSADDDQLYMFTNEQVQFMRGVLAEGGPRSGLVTASCRSVFPAKSLHSREEVSQLQPLRVLTDPNPVQTKFTVSIIHDKVYEELQSVEVYGIEGSLVAHQLVGKGVATAQFNAANWVSGTYLIRVTTRAGEIVTKRIVVQ